ncbi:MAG TPA: alpha/beta hydrolase [Firmicutes bacterium]|nr:alpha/beta hydrolase [Bacillota bacterium]
MQKAVEITSRGLTLRGMLHIPDGISGRIPVAAIFHGFTGNKMEPHFIFVKLSRLLEKKGIASVRFDFGGSGESDGDFADMTLSKELEDAKAILAFVKQLDFVNLERIAVVGLSMGGVVASMLAGDCREDIKALCLWAPAGNMRDIPLKGKSNAEISEADQKGFLDIGGLALGTEFIKDIHSFDFWKKPAQYDKKVLILHGNRDETVPFDTSRQYLEVYGDKAKLHTIDGGDHTFNNLEQENEVLDYTIGFLEEELKG